ncbi:MAG TPA: hypothetical protein VFP95_01830, partial [Gammaproteobacteria bacterium]|nr:hypothetical protein [Gammaproteobacteria bacterium]
MPAPSSPAKQPTAQLADKSSPPKTADTPAKRYVLQGQLDLSADDVYLTDDAASKAIVYYVPNQDAKSRSPGTYQIVTKNKRFVPEVMAIPVGSTVKFP